MSTFDFEKYIAERNTAQAGAVDAVRALVTEHERSTTQNEALQVKVAELEAEIARLQEGGGSIATRTRFGACPAKPGGTSLAAAQTVVTKWGKGAAVRQFYSATDVGMCPPDSSIMHGSWKPSAAQITETWAQTVLKNYRDGDCAEVWHEADKKVSDGAYTYEDLLARKNKFYDIVKKVRPGIRVVNTVTGWMMDPKSGKDPSRWGAVKADVFGIDCDGVRPTALPYTNYEAETKAALEFIEKYKANGYQWFAVPEYGCPRITATDADGSKRALYHDYYCNLWADSGKCLYVTLYEYDSSPNYSLTTQAEIAQFKNWVNAS